MKNINEINEILIISLEDKIKLLEEQKEINEKIIEIQEQQLILKDVSKSVAIEWGEFIIRCDREGRPLLLLDDYIEQYS